MVLAVIDQESTKVNADPVSWVGNDVVGDLLCLDPVCAPHEGSSAV